MRLRKLEIQDSERMLEWMHDKKTTEYLLRDFKNYTLEDCKNFIKNCQDFKCNCHMAIDDNGIYVGTVSLKNICNHTAEFAFVIHPKEVGKGYSDFAIKNIILYGFEKLNLEKIYWNVMPKNERAIRVYKRNGFNQVEYREIEKLGGGGQNTQRKKSNHFFGIWSRKKNRKTYAAEPCDAGGNSMKNKVIDYAYFIEEAA